MADKKKLSPLMFLPPVIFAGLAALFFIGMQREDPNALPSTLIGQAAPGVALAPLADVPLLTDDVLREPGAKLVNFWGTWCVACRQEHPQLLAMAEQGIVIHGINYDDTPARATGYLEREGNPFTALGEDTTGRTKIDWGVYGAPETFVVDGEGVIHLRHAGPITADVLTRIILPALEKAAAQ
ncbi:Cytochrome c-type biogenesis protein CcmG/DsbE, thiol:disulfide oxidoreductase [Rhodovulum sp. P5]|uniref:DsbE family thiol:disulfide interchange protein n=1 Tax=Rhodovulum sp. P5 TaxID=1564506 RepID=UPI0009C1C586|nr:DsbE family thiol:disulfide interchange protein [Rhodovulum sp. P5]ARE38489.1 Cytochrome c-type biogenesis protein CcmG/DsbE, thiol:disulfide oxidoreductase [Rhodovulum sp. P5]